MDLLQEYLSGTREQEQPFYGTKPEGSLEGKNQDPKGEVGRYKYLEKGCLSDHMLHRYQLPFLPLARFGSEHIAS